MFLTDVGGIYRSTDGGKNWTLSMVGYHARGGNDVAFDPRNADRLLVVAGNSTDHPGECHGVYLSTDRGASWKQTLPRTEAHHGSLVIDPHSFDDAQGFCTRVWFLSKPGELHRSDDGGVSWTKLDGVGPFPLGRLALHPTRKGVIYVTSPSGPETRGFYRSLDAGVSFQRTNEQTHWHLSVSPADPEVVYVARADGPAVSRDAGATFQALSSEGRTLPIAHSELIFVSPVDPNRLVLTDKLPEAWWARQSYVSHDGGQTWQGIRFDDFGSFFPRNVREARTAWHPTDANKLLGIGGDWATFSDDGGRTLRWSNNGQCAVMLGGHFNFSRHHPEVVALFFQDYNGAVTRDGGETWTYYDVSGKGWGGYNYGGYTADGVTIFGGDAPDWGDRRTLRISHDSGNTWQVAIDSAKNEPIRFTGSDTSFADPIDPTILFASNWRSADNGKSWQIMTDCDGVFGHAPGQPDLLIGRNNRSLVTSRDRGQTWQIMATHPRGTIRDAAFDPGNNRWYASVDRALWVFADGEWSRPKLPRDQYGNTFVHTVAVDPVDPSIVYAGGSAYIYATKNALWRSFDAGRTWTAVTQVGPGGEAPHEVECVRVHPVTRDVWMNGQCFGMWRMRFTGVPASRGAAADADDAPARPKDQPAQIIRSFANRGFDYLYGNTWEGAVKVTNEAVEIRATEWGGGGVVLGAANLTPNAQEHIGIRVKLLEGNVARRLQMNLLGSDRSVTFDLSRARPTEFVDLTVRLPREDYSRVEQIQIQGTNFGDSAAPLRLAISRIFVSHDEMGS
ncbi:MAG TPA: hypothetical protein PKB10_05490, partial [Tepidisphaeraceae bacterium]|nr:hypothetical protein [Tepidisphaeraceae bacterium]